MEKTKATAGVCIDNSGEKQILECDIDTMEKVDGEWVCDTCRAKTEEE